LRKLLLTALVLGVVPGVAHAQIPDHFTNLKVLPKDISKEQLLGTMRAFAGGLGVGCDYCHADAKDNPRELDFTSDAKDEKRTARLMLKMVAAINGDYISQVDPKTDVRVGCVTCHHGIPQPQTIDALVGRKLASDGLEKAVASYRELREKYYGRAAYDFGPGPLNALAERLIHEKKADDALGVLGLDAEYHPEASGTQLLMGEAYASLGDHDKAREAFKKALALDPNNRRAQHALAALDAPAKKQP
jgi:tetratricopeptide (TPR) repeat protein